MYTLFKSICGGVSWGDVVDPLMACSYWAVAVFCLYIVFVIFCVLNIVTAVFLESTQRVSMIDEDKLTLEHIEEKKKWFESVRFLFEKTDADSSGYIDWPEFQEGFKDVKVQALFQVVGLDVGEQSARQ